MRQSGWISLALSVVAQGAAAEVEVSLYGGTQGALDSRVTHSTLGSVNVGWDGRSKAMPPYWGLRVTRWSGDWGFGGEFNHAKIYADDPASYGYDVLEFSDGLNFLTLNALRRWQPTDLSITPYVGAGLGIALPHVEVAPAGQARTFGYQVTGPAVAVFVGLSYAIDERWSLFGEYKTTWSRNEAELDSGGTLSADIVTNAINVGVGFRF